MFSTFTVDQEHAADEILSAVRARCPACIFVNGQGRSGKTCRLRMSHESTINQLPDEFPTTTLPPVVHSTITKCLQTAPENSSTNVQSSKPYHLPKTTRGGAMRNHVRVLTFIWQTTPTKNLSQCCGVTRPSNFPKLHHEQLKLLLLKTILMNNGL